VHPSFLGPVHANLLEARAKFRCADTAVPAASIPSPRSLPNQSISRITAAESIHSSILHCACFRWAGLTKLHPHFPHSTPRIESASLDIRIYNNCCSHYALSQIVYRGVATYRVQLDYVTPKKKKPFRRTMKSVKSHRTGPSSLTSEGNWDTGGNKGRYMRIYVWSNIMRSQQARQEIRL
jgi:hypothetical protein